MAKDMQRLWMSRSSVENGLCYARCFLGLLNLQGVRRLVKQRIASSLSIVARLAQW